MCLKPNKVKLGRATKEIAEDVKSIKTKGKLSSNFWYKKNDDSKLGDGVFVTPQKELEEGAWKALRGRRKKEEEEDIV